MGLPLAHRFLVFRLLLILILTSHFSTLNSVRAQGVGPNRQFYLVHDYADDWQVYDEGVKTYVPYIQERHDKYSSFSLFLNLETARHYRLLCFSEGEGYLFFDASLQRQIRAGTWVVLNVDSLYRRYRKPELLLTFYSRQVGTGATTPSEATPADKKVLLGYQRVANQRPVATAGDLLLAKPRPTADAFGNFFVLGGLLLLLSFAFLFLAYHKAFTRIFSLRDLLTINPRDPTLSINTSLDASNLFFVFHLSLSLAFLYMLVANENIDLFASQLLLREGQTLGNLFLNFLEVALLMFALFMGKYLVLNVLGGLYRFERLVDYHFFKIVQASSLFFSGLLLVGMVTEVSFPRFSQQTNQYVFVPVVLFYLLRLGLLYFSINKLASVKNLYLFSYLCIVELIPIIVGIRFAL